MLCNLIPVNPYTKLTTEDIIEELHQLDETWLIKEEGSMFVRGKYKFAV